MPQRPSTSLPASPTGSLSSSTAAAIEADADVGRYYVFVDEMLHRGAAGVVDRFFADDFIEHGASGDHCGDEYVARLAARRACFPDAVWTIELLVSAAGLVLCHTTMTTPALIARASHMWETVVVRFSVGRIAECWRVCDERLLAAEAGSPVLL